MCCGRTIVSDRTHVTVRGAGSGWASTCLHFGHIATGHALSRTHMGYGVLDHMRPDSMLRERLGC